MGFFNFVETFFFISLAITFVLILLLVYHFKQKIVDLEKTNKFSRVLHEGLLKELYECKSGLIALASMVNSANGGGNGEKIYDNGPLNVKANIVELSDIQENESETDTESESELSDNLSVSTSSDGETITYEDENVDVEVVEDVPMIIDEIIMHSIPQDVNVSSEVEHIGAEVVLARDIELVDNVFTSLQNEEYIEGEGDAGEPIEKYSEEGEEYYIEEEFYEEVPYEIQEDVHETADTPVSDESELKVVTLPQVEEHLDIHVPMDIESVSDVHVNKLETTIELDAVSTITETKDSYKKLNIHQLKALAISRGVATDVAKLKKNDLIKLLENMDEDK